MSKKPVIVFEGIEGSGKSFHIENVSKFLKKKKVDHVKIREPGGNHNAEKIRKLILSNKSSFNKNTDLLLYLASRSENIEILKKNFNKRVILIDRFTDSTIAYQHYGFGINLNLINFLNNYLLGNLKVSFTFLNIVNPKNLYKRLKKRKRLNRYDKFKKNFYTRVQNGFLKQAKRRKNKYLIIDSNLEKIVNTKKILHKVDMLIK